MNNTVLLNSGYTVPWTGVRNTTGIDRERQKQNMIYIISGLAITAGPFLV